MNKLDRAVKVIDRRGVLLIFPIANRPEPRSLWSELHPRSVMRWEWDQGGDTKVHDLWHLRSALARSRRVIYTKWFKNRATVFAKPVFRAMLADLMARADLVAGLSREASALLTILEDDSPQSTKALRKASGLPDNRFQAALKELWSRLLIVGIGEVDDGAFPSLAVGATRLLFEGEWSAAKAGASASDHEALAAALEGGPAFARELDRVRASLSTIAPRTPVAAPAPPAEEVLYGSLAPRPRSSRR